jgi:hypothetical protein
MSHWAEVDESNVVIRVVVGDNNDPNGDEGYQWLIDNLGGNWIKTSYNTYEGVHREGGVPFRKNFAGIGFIYDPIRDAFYSQKPYPSWVLDEDTCSWQPPTPKPTGKGIYVWVENELNWQLITP